MSCPRCQTRNPDGANFCNACGLALRDGELAPSRNDFDPQSYTPKYLADKILTSKSAIEGERKSVTVLFADVAGYTSLAERLGPERAHEVMDGCFKILLDEIHRCEGTINQFTGDGIMALFGAPIAHEDHAHRACLAALGIQRALADYARGLHARYGIEFKMRMGLNSGPVVVGSIGDDLRMDYTAIGDTTNLAARMEAMADPGRILLTENTHKITQRDFTCRSIGRHAVKGKQQRVEVFTLEGRQAALRSPWDPERTIASEMVGRDREMEELLGRVSRVIEGRGSIVGILGEAGIGKSRLVAELKGHPVMENTLLLEGRANSMGRNLSFHLLIDVLRNWARIRDYESEAASFQRLRAAVTTACGEDADEVLPFVATLMGMPLDRGCAERVEGIEGEALEKLIVKSMRSLLARLADRGPVVIVLEDLHWADTSSMTVLESMFRLAETHRVLFLNALRPGHTAAADRLLDAARERYPDSCADIRLQPMDEAASDTLIMNALNIAGLHHRVRRAIIERSGGNPFFIEEVLRSLVDEGAVVRKHGAFHTTEKIHTMVIPQTINDVLLARIDRLEERTKELIKIASVIGRSFFHRVLADVASSLDDINRRLEFLTGIQLIRERRRLKELEYLFKHALVHEATYGSILSETRKELHLRVAESIHRVFTGRLHEFHGMLAYHYSRGEDEDNAQKYLLKAGEEALKSSASTEALHYYQEALTLYLRKYGSALDPARVASMERNIGLALYNKGQYEECVEYFDRGLAHGPGRAPGRLLSVVLGTLWAFLHLLAAVYLPAVKFRKPPGEKDREVVDLLYKKCKALAMIDPKRFFLESLRCYKIMTAFDLSAFPNGVALFAGASSLFSFTGLSFRLSRRILDTARDRFAGDTGQAALVLDLLETIHNYFVGNWGRIRDHDEALVRKSLSVGEIYDASQHLYWHCFPSIYQGSLQRARAMVEGLHSISEEFDNDLSTLFKYEVNTHLLLESRELPEALTEVDRGIAFAEKEGSDFFLIEMYACKALIQVLLDDLEKANRALRSAERVRRGLESPVPMQLATFYRSRLAYEICRLRIAMERAHASETERWRNRASTSSSRLLRIAKPIAHVRTESCRLRGCLFWLQGRQKEALTCWRRAIREGERLGARLQLSRVYADLGRHLQEAESRYTACDGVSAEEYLARARTLFEEMGLTWDLSRSPFATAA